MLSRAKPWFGALALLLVALPFVLPIFWMLSASLRQPGLPPPRTIEWIPSPITWTNYVRVFEMLPFGKYLLNSLLVTFIAVPCTLLTASLAGYATSRLGPKDRQTIVYGAIALQLVPLITLWLPRFLMFKQVGITNTFWSLLIPVVMGSAPLFTLLYYRSCRSIPTSLFEAAELDGAPQAKVWWRVAMPLVRSTTMAVSSLTFLMFWGDYLNPILYLKSQALYTLPVGLQQLQQLDKTNWPLLMAASTILVAPTVVMFLLVQKFFLQDGRLGGATVE